MVNSNLKEVNYSDTATLIAAVIAALASFTAVILSNRVSTRVNKLNAEVIEKQRLVSSISTQRIEWINGLRIQFSTFNKKSFEYANIIRRVSQNPDLDLPREDNLLVPEIYYCSDLIYLYLNPLEEWNSNYYEIQKSLLIDFKRGSHNPQTFDYNLYEKQSELLIKYQQIILKAEWKIVKKEIKLGNELDSTETEKIYLEVASKVDLNIYQRIKTNLQNS